MQGDGGLVSGAGTLIGGAKSQKLLSTPGIEVDVAINANGFPSVTINDSTGVLIPVVLDQGARTEASRCSLALARSRPSRAEAGSGRHVRWWIDHRARSPSSTDPDAAGEGVSPTNALRTPRPTRARSCSWANSRACARAVRTRALLHAQLATEDAFCSRRKGGREPDVATVDRDGAVTDDEGLLPGPRGRQVCCLLLGDIPGTRWTGLPGSRAARAPERLAEELRAAVASCNLDWLAEAAPTTTFLGALNEAVSSAVYWQ